MPPCETALEWIEAERTANGAVTAVSRFLGGGGVEEWHIILTAAHFGHDAAKMLHQAWHETLDTLGIPVTSTVMRRVFCRDPAHQAPQLLRFTHTSPGAFSIIGQAPTGGADLALWSQHIVDPEGSLDGSGGPAAFTCKRGLLRHLWLSGLHDVSRQDMDFQTESILKHQDDLLHSHGMTLEDHVVRTWWFIRDIDANYQGLVDARMRVFVQHGLTENTHYIASTGIGGCHENPAALVSLDTYAIGGISPEQIEHLSAPELLGPTHAYGVTFERATAITYADRRHILLSGTASIDPEGRIMHPGDVLGQLDRTLQNISGLLAAAGAAMDDLAMILVYLRDPQDGAVIEAALRERFQDLPVLILHAPVCRPGWLIEIEGIAIIAAHHPEFASF